MKRLMILLPLLIAAMLCGCSLDMPKTGKGNADSTSSQEKSSIVGIKTGGQENAADSQVIYESSGVKISVLGFAKNQLDLTAENTTGKDYRLRSVYVAADGAALSNISVDQELPANAKTDFSFSAPGICKLSARLFLTDDSSEMITGSLSDTIELTLSDKITLQPKQLYKVLYSDENFKLGFKQATYRDSSNTVRIELYAENLTDKDIYLLSGETVCDHEDYTASVRCFIPAKCSSSIMMRAYTGNSTISAADLDSITFSLTGFPLEYYYNEVYTDSLPVLFTTDTITLTLPREGRPEVTVPETMQYAGDLSEYRAEVLDGDGITEMPDVLDGSTKSCEDGNVLLEYLFGFEREYAGEKVWCFAFRCQNKLQKQIRLGPVGAVNGATVPFSCLDTVKAMTEEYVLVMCYSDLYELTPEVTDVTMWFEVNYDDGHYDETSYIGSTSAVKLAYSDKLIRPDPPEDAKLVYSDALCELWLIKAEDTESGPDLLMYARNLSDELISVTVSSDDGNCYFSGSIPMFRSTYCVTTLRMRSFSDTTPTAQTLEGLNIHITVSDTDGEALSYSEAKL